MYFIKLVDLLNYFCITGYSCKLLTQGMPLVIINEDSHDDCRETLRRHIETFGDQIGKQNDVGLIVDGTVS